jgi:UDP-N-acetylmuramate: L-alanyl-gamma-D-glutamyl-meso-diaminopimelate ligase
MRIYFMGICGTAMGNAALLVKEQGHEVLGCDAAVYPPMSDVLADAGIEVLDGFDSSRLAALKPDQVVVGNAMSRGNPEVEWLLDQSEITFISLPELIHDTVLPKRCPVVITGTHGKTSTSTITAYLLECTDAKPGWLIGGVPNDLSGGAKLGEGKAFVIEGDEYDSAFFDKRSKFIHYRPQIAILNNLEFDHADIFRDLEDVQRSFRHFLRVIPASGYALVNGDDPNIAALLPAPWTQVSSGHMSHGPCMVFLMRVTRLWPRFLLLWLQTTMIRTILTFHPWLTFKVFAGVRMCFIRMIVGRSSKTLRIILLRLQARLRHYVLPTQIVR